MYIGFVHKDDMKAHDKLSVTLCCYSEAGVTASLIVIRVTASLIVTRVTASLIATRVTASLIMTSSAGFFNSGLECRLL